MHHKLIIMISVFLNFWLGFVILFSVLATSIYHFTIIIMAYDYNFVICSEFT